MNKHKLESSSKMLYLKYHESFPIIIIIIINGKNILILIKSLYTDNGAKI